MFDYSKNVPLIVDHGATLYRQRLFSRGLIISFRSRHALVRNVKKHVVSVIVALWTIWICKS